MNSNNFPVLPAPPQPTLSIPMTFSSPIPAANLVLNATAPNGFRIFEVIVPPNAKSGQAFMFTIYGKNTTLTCPVNVYPGHVIRFQLPTKALGGLMGPNQQAESSSVGSSSQKPQSKQLQKQHHQQKQQHQQLQNLQPQQQQQQRHDQQQQQTMSIPDEIHLDDLEGFEDLSDQDTFHNYHTVSLHNCVPHPDPLVQSSSLAAVDFPKIR